jgi:hypothetical protein
VRVSEIVDCREAVKRMWAYLEHSDVLEPKETAELEAHLEVCQRCCGELEFNRELRGMVGRRAHLAPTPRELRSWLDELISSAEQQTEEKR